MLLATVCAYLTILTQDVYLGPAPVKVPLVATALAVWWFERGRRMALSDFSFAWPVIILSIASPLIWTLVALYTRSSGSDVARIDMGDSLQHASRFGYLLLYFPLADLLGAATSRRQYGWLGPVLVLAAITWALWIGLAVFDASYRDQTQFLLFGGIFGKQGDQYRVLIGNQILFIPAIALLLSRIIRVRWSWPLIGMVALVLTATVHAHTRGIWLGIAVAALAVGVMQFRAPLRLVRTGLRSWIVPAALTAVVTTMSAVLLSRAVPLPEFLGDESAGLRLSQSEYLYEAWRAHPILGSGLGASLVNGYQRSVADPWSFELTYLQVLFQMGVLGLAVVLWIPAAALARGLPAVTQATDEGADSTALEAGLAALVAIFIASATNPYLLSAFGMLGVAIALALTDRGLAAVTAGPEGRTCS